MNNPLFKLRKAAESIRLSYDEKEVLRARIMRATQGTEAPRRVVSSYSWFSIRFAMPVALILVLVFGSGTAYAAQGSLPGSLLYPVKIYVNEGVGEALAFSNEAKVSFHTTVAEERLKEAETLAAEGRLDATLAEQIEASFDTHVAKADTIAMNFEEEDSAEAVEATIRIDSALLAHGVILAKIGSDSDDEETQKNSSSIVERVRARSGGIAIALTADVGAQMETMAFSVTMDASATSNPSSAEGENVRAKSAKSKTTVSIASTTQKKIATQLEKKAQKEFRDIKEEYGDARNSLSASTSAKAKLQIEAIGKHMEEGRAQLKAGAYETARATFTEVIRNSVELSAFIEASKKFNRDFVKRLWNANFGDNDGEGEKEDGEVENEDTEDKKKDEEDKNKKDSILEIPGTNIQVQL